MDDGMIVEGYLSLEDERNNTDKWIISDNIVKYLQMVYPNCVSQTDIKVKLAEITKTNQHTVYAWINNSRTNVKIPLSKLHMLSEALGVDIRNFFR